VSGRQAGSIAYSGEFLLIFFHSNRILKNIYIYLSIIEHKARVFFTYGKFSPQIYTPPFKRISLNFMAVNSNSIETFTLVSFHIGTFPAIVRRISFKLYLFIYSVNHSR
jgi:hypothetical protein